MYLFYETLPKFEFDTLMRIDSCEFRNGVDISEESSGLSMYFYNTVQDSDFTRGIAKSGIKLAVMHDQSEQAVLLRTLLRMGRNRPGNIYINTIPDIPYTTKKSSQTYLGVHISDSKFHDNIGGGVNIELYMGYKNTKYQVLINKCSFQRNLSPIGSSIRIGQPIVLPTKSGLEVLIKNTDFMYDTIHDIQKKNSNSNGFNVIAVYKLKLFAIINCIFAVNKQTALQAFDSTVYFGGQVVFSENNGSLGGAMMLQGGSKFYLFPPHSH